MATRLSGSMYKAINKVSKQFEKKMVEWFNNLSLVILYSGEKPREIFTIEYNKNLWECFLLMTANNDKAKLTGDAHLYEYIICHHLPFKSLTKYTLEEFYDHMITFKREEKKEEKIVEPLDNYENKPAQVGYVRSDSIKGVSIE